MNEHIENIRRTVESAMTRAHVEEDLDYIDTLQHILDQISYYDASIAPNDTGCLHDNCPNCKGSGINQSGGACFHGISCPCPKCATMC